MNRKPSGLETQKAIQGFIQSKTAEGLSASTIVSYTHHLDLWIEYQGETELRKVTAQDIRSFLSYMLTEYTPRRIFGNKEERLSPKSVRNIWVTLSSFYRWVTSPPPAAEACRNRPSNRPARAG
jgi:site-specific recombinase XerD